METYTWRIHDPGYDRPGEFSDFEARWHGEDDEDHFEYVAEEYAEENCHSDWDNYSRYEDGEDLLIKSPSGVVKTVFVQMEMRAHFEAEIKKAKP